MSEVTADGQPGRAVADDAGDQAPVKGAALEWVRAVAVSEGHQQRCQQGPGRGGQHHPREAHVVEGADQVGGGLAHRQGAHHRADGQSPGRTEPGRDHLHGRRVDPGQEEAGQKTPDQSRAVTGDEDQQGVGHCAEQGRGGEEDPRGDDVGQVQDRRQQGAGHESELDHGREPGALIGRETPQHLQAGSHRAGREPERHAQQFGGTEQGQDAPAGRMGIGRACGGCIGFGRTGAVHGHTIVETATSAIMKNPGQNNRMVFQCNF